MTYDELWDVHQMDDEEQEFDAATRRAYQINADRRQFLDAQERRDTGHGLDDDDEDPAED
jgi:hypothetical protein